MDRERPNILFAQRDSDSLKDVEASRASAFSQFTQLAIRTGSALIDQFQGSYIPRVFSLTLPWCVGGPDLRGRARYRRDAADAPMVCMDAFTAMVPRRVEMNIRCDWDLLPGVWSLNFASKVNLGVSLSIRRGLRRDEEEPRDEKKIGAMAAKVYDLLWNGEFVRPDGGRQQIHGDTSKILDAVGLSKTQRALINNDNFMSSKIPGTRQIRRTISHVVFSARIVYGLPVFMTITPGERHSTLIVRLMRYRRNDPGITYANPEFAPWIGHDSPSLESEHLEEGEESCTFEIPDYDLRRLMNARDGLAGVEAYDLAIRTVMATLYGLRVCPECPHCALSGKPCMDMFGSNATPMGGSAGGADAAVGATEAQKAKGVLHLHFFLFLQTVYQFNTLATIAEMFRQRLLSMDTVKTFHNHLRRATYPDIDAFHKAQTKIESEWPAYPKDTVLSRAPCYAWDSLRPRAPPWLTEHVSVATWYAEGRLWQQHRDIRLQHVLSHMNHHVHPVIDPATGERRPLSSCQPKNRPKECKSGFPLDNEMTDIALLVCPCVAAERDLQSSGPRSAIGCILPARNDRWVNAAPTIWAEFSGDNGDIKFPYRVPILEETHETKLYDVRRCCRKTNELQLAYEVQVAQSATAGYFGGYSSKMQDVGKRELNAMAQAVSRKVDATTEPSTAKTFIEYSRRLVRDLEGKGIIRTVLETINLAVHAESKDILRAECFRTFPTVTFPASLLLRREEVETGKVPGACVIAAVHAAGGSFSRRAYLEAPFDLLYGFRGSGQMQELLSPFEMLRHWSMEEVRPPAASAPVNRSEFTDAGWILKENDFSSPPTNIC